MLECKVHARLLKKTKLKKYTRGHFLVRFNNCELTPYICVKSKERMEIIESASIHPCTLSFSCFIVVTPPISDYSRSTL